jgi:hypothetical protein
VQTKAPRSGTSVIAYVDVVDARHNAGRQKRRRQRTERTGALDRKVDAIEQTGKFVYRGRCQVEGQEAAAIR